MTIEKNKYRYQAVLLIILIFTALGFRLWASHRAFSIEGPANIRKGPDGLVYIMNDTKLYLHDQNGDLMDIKPLGRFGLERAKGDFWIFNNGDLLLRRETNTKLTFRRELETFFRTGSSKQDRIESNDGILQRCNMNSYECIPFGSGRDAFSKIGAFKVFVDEGKGDVYITDTPAHQLLLYDLNGNLKRKSDVRFHYPNGLVGGNDHLLYIADTNHHRIAAVNPEYSAFGRIERQFSIINTVGPPEKEWPFALGQDRNGRWWVINAGNEMRHGDLVIYDGTGQVFKRVELPENADPTSIAVLENRVLVTDPSLMRVYSVALNGELQDDFGSRMFRFDCSDKLHSRNFYAALSSIMLYTILLGAIAAIIIAWKAQASLTNQDKQQSERIAGREKAGEHLQARYEPTHNSEAVEGGLVSIPRFPASHGWIWLSDAFSIVKNSSRIYVVLFLVSLLRWQGILRIPEIGYLLLLFVSPLIVGILMILVRMVVNNTTDARNMKIVPPIVDLLYVGAVYCIILGSGAIIAQVIAGKPIVPVILLGKFTEFNRIFSQGVDPSLLIGALLLAGISLVLFAASWFAPPLIVFKKYSFKKAMVLSFKAVVRNIRAFNLFAIVLCGIWLVFAVAMFVIPGIVFIPLGLATFVKPVSAIMAILLWPLLAPIITLSVYTGYVRLFETKPATSD